MSANKAILLVEDERKLLTSTSALLEHAGYSVSTAEGGAEAIALLQNQVFDLMLLDLNMPDVSGLDVLDFVAEHQLRVSTVVLSGETTFAWVSEAFRKGAYDFIKKPYEFDGLLNTIANVLRKKELENNYQQLSRQLERSEKLHRFMIESSPDIIFIVDKEGNIAFINDRAKTLLGYEKDELIGKHYSSIVAPECMDEASHCFTERRIDERAVRDAEISLMCKRGHGKTADDRKLAIELNAMGVYENEESVTNAAGNEAFSGTYVVARDITDRLASERLIHYQAYHDLLTGLPNRALFMDRLNMAINTAKREERKLAIMFLDLDRFKVVNDTLGHSEGDKLLKHIARRLKVCLRDSDTLARIGGDEFIILLPDADSEQVAQTVARKVVKHVKGPIQLAGQEVIVTASVGISMYPDDGSTAENLIKNSDIAMYHTKDQGKDGFHLYLDEMSVKHHQQLNVENAIRKGIREGQFDVYYQPQVNSRNGEVIGVEALLRWNHPEKELLLPAYFLGVAEECGLIVELGEFVLDRAVKEVQQWHEEGLTSCRLAVNFSARQIEQWNFVENISRALEDHGFPGKFLEIEITESILMNNVEATAQKLRELHGIGVQVAIDDFGTGYSSLSLLQQLPINRLKIDRSFIQSITPDSDRSIIEAIAHIAGGLKLDMVAEGVELEVQLNYLQGLNCPIIQGFIYSKALPASEMKALLRQSAAQNQGLREVKNTA